MIDEGNRIILQPLTREYIRSLRGLPRGQLSALKLRWLTVNWYTHLDAKAATISVFYVRSGGELV